MEIFLVFKKDTKDGDEESTECDVKRKVKVYTEVLEM